MQSVFFDLDGTLTDPKPGITRCIQHALSVLDSPVPSEDELTWCIGPPLLDSFTQLLGDEALAHRAIGHYRERFGDVGLFENSVYAGIAQLLASLHGEQRDLYVATSKPTVYAERIVAHFGLSQFFIRVFGSELSGERTDKTELLRYALAQSDARAAGCVMIGDRSHDVIGAKNNGIPAFGVLYGYGDSEELRAAGADELAADPGSLQALLVMEG